MKKLQYFLLIIIVFSFFSCSVQSKLSRQFKGKDKTELDNYFGEKGSIVQLPGNIQYVAYTRLTRLNGIDISKGVTTLDPMTSPPVKKIQKYLFYLDQAGKVTGCKYDIEYEREK